MVATHVETEADRAAQVEAVVGTLAELVFGNGETRVVVDEQRHSVLARLVDSTGQGIGYSRGRTPEMALAGLAYTLAQRLWEHARDRASVSRLRCPSPEATDGMD